MTEVSAFMPKTTQEVVGLLSILFFLFLILGSLRSWARRVPNATTRLPAGVDGLLFLPARPRDFSTSPPSGSPWATS